MSRIIISKRAEKFILKQPRDVAERLTRAIYALPSGDVKSMKGSKQNRYRLRVGNYRVIYDD